MPPPSSALDARVAKLEVQVTDLLQRLSVAETNIIHLQSDSKTALTGLVTLSTSVSALSAQVQQLTTGLSQLEAQTNLALASLAKRTSDLEAAVAYLFGIYKPPTPAATIALANGTVVEDAAEGAAAGTLTTNLTGTVTWTNDNAKFDLSQDGSAVATLTVSAAGEGNLTNGNPETVNITATSGAGSAQDAFAIDVTASQAGSTVAQVKVVSTDSGNAQTDVPVQFGVPVPAGLLSTSQHLVGYVSGVAIPTQQSGYSTDRSGAIRHAVCCCVVPSLPASGEVVIEMRAVSGAPSASPAKTVSELLALASDAEALVTIVDGGVTRTASMRAALVASTTWAKGSAHRRAGFFQDGAICKEAICGIPLKNGGVADPFLMAWFHVAFFSTDNFSTVKGVRIQCLATNSFLDQVSPSDRWTSFKIETGLGSPATAINYQTQTPGVGISIAGGTAQTRAVTTSPVTNSTFTIDDLGKIIAAGPDSLTVVAVAANGSSCTARITNTASSGGSYAGGAWTLHGLRLPFKSAAGKDVWCGTESKAVVVHRTRDLTLESHLLPEFDYPADQINLMSPGVGGSEESSGGSGVAASGTNPMSIRLNSNLTFRGERYLSGNEPEARVIHATQATSVAKYGADGFMLPFGLQRCLFTTDLWNAEAPVIGIDDTTGLDVYWGTTSPNRSTWIDSNFKTASNQAWNQGTDTAHIDNMNYVAYLLTGRFHYLEAAHRFCIRLWMSLHYDANRGASRRYMRSIQIRAQFWSARAVEQTALMTPDNLPRALLAHSKADLAAWGAANQLDARQRYVRSDSNPSVSGFSLETPPGPTSNRDGMLWLAYGGGNLNDTPNLHTWQVSYGGLVGAHLLEIGQLTADGVEFYSRVVRHTITRFLDPDLLAREATPLDSIYFAIGKQPFNVGGSSVVKEGGYPRPGPYFSTWNEAYSWSIAATGTVGSVTNVTAGFQMALSAWNLTRTVAGVPAAEPVHSTNQFASTTLTFGMSTATVALRGVSVTVSSSTKAASPQITIPASGLPASPQAGDTFTIAGTYGLKPNGPWPNNGVYYACYERGLLLVARAFANTAFPAATEPEIVQVQTYIDTTLAQMGTIKIVPGSNPPVADLGTWSTWNIYAKDMSYKVGA